MKGRNNLEKISLKYMEIIQACNAGTVLQVEILIC